MHDADLSASAAAAVDDFRRHLEAERDLSVHTVRAYTGDVTALLAHAGSRGIAEPGALDVSVLRSWLGSNWRCAWRNCCRRRRPVHPRSSGRLRQGVHGLVPPAWRAGG